MIKKRGNLNKLAFILDQSGRLDGLLDSGGGPQTSGRRHGDGTRSLAARFQPSNGDAAFRFANERSLGSRALALARRLALLVAAVWRYGGITV